MTPLALVQERKGIRVGRAHSIGRKAGAWGDGTGDRICTPEDPASTFPSKRPAHT